GVRSADSLLCAGAPGDANRSHDCASLRIARRLLCWSASVLRLLYRAADALRRRSRPNDHGRMGEDFAHRYLRGHGCAIVARNYRTRSAWGEIDIVAWHGETLAFVEVKTRTTAAFGEPESAVDSEKRERLQLAARDYARRA